MFFQGFLQYRTVLQYIPGQTLNSSTFQDAAKTAHAAGKDWKREIYVFLANYRDTCHPSSGKSPYQLSMGRPIRTKIPRVEEVVPDNQVRQRDEQAKMKMKVYADKRRHTEPHNLQTGDAVLVKQRRRKTCTPYEQQPYVVEGVKGSMITTERIPDGRHVVRNSAHFKRLNKSPEEIRRQSHYVEPDEPELAEQELQQDTHVTPPDVEDTPQITQPRSQGTVTVTRSGRTSKKTTYWEAYVSQ